MHYSLLFSLCCLIYLSLLLLMYYTKDKTRTFQNKLFEILTFLGIFFCLFMIISVSILYKINNQFWVKFTWRICWSNCIIWYCFFYYYYNAIIYKNDYKSLFQFIKKDKLTFYITILFIIAIFTYLFILPFAGLDINNMTYLPGITSYIVWGFSAALNIIVLILMFKNKSELTKKEMRIISNTLFITFICMGIQVLFNSVSIIPIGFTIQMYLFYLLNENPDLVLLNTSNKVNEKIENMKKSYIDIYENVMYKINDTSNDLKNDIDKLKNNFNDKNTLDEIVKKGNLFLDKIDKLFNSYSLESLKMNKVDYSVTTLANDIYSDASKRILNKKISLKINISREMPKLLNGDYSKLLESICYIVQNAIEYTKVGKVIINIDTVNENNIFKLFITIIDTGEGINKDENILENTSNIGNGLAIAKKYISFMNGKIWYKSSYKVGTTFYVELPQDVKNKELLEDTKLIIDTKMQEFARDCSNVNILIVDGSEININLFKRLVKKYNFNIDAVKSEEECINLIKLDKKYDLIFLDDEMNGINGPELLKIIKTINSNICPIIAMTANSLPDLETYYLNNGFSYYLPKPCDLKKLNLIINKYLDK